MVWLATARLAGAPAISPAFNVKGQRGLFGQFEVAQGLSLDPKRFEPTVSFHEWATHRVFDGRAVRRAPYEPISIGDSLNLAIENVDASVFVGNIAVVRVSATVTLGSTSDLRTDLATLQDLRSSKELLTVRRLISLAFDRLGGEKTGKQPLRVYDDYFVMQVELPPSALDFPSEISEFRADIVGLLIGTRNPQTLKDEVIDRTIGFNEELNSKSRNELLLLNRKGALLVRPSGKYDGPHVDRLAKTRDLAIISQFTRCYLRSLQDNEISRGPSEMAALERIRRWIRQPELTFFSSVSQTLTWITLSRAMLLEENLVAATGSSSLG